MTEDGNILVVVSNLDIEDQQGKIIDMEDGDIEIDCEENLEYSSARLQQGHGSVSSVHSEPDNADNCSVTVALSVSSLGSDNEDDIHDEDFIHYPDESNKQKQRREDIMDSQAQVLTGTVKVDQWMSVRTEFNSLSINYFFIININNNGNIIIIINILSPFIITLKYCSMSLHPLPLPSVWYPVYKGSSCAAMTQFFSNLLLKK